jgi:hypothetical protein
VTDSEPAIKRSDAPTARRHNDRMIEVNFALNQNPDSDWEREFERAVQEAGAAPTASVSRLNQQKMHPGVRPSRPRYSVDFFINTPEEMAPAVQALDGCISTANERYRDVVLPRREARQRREEEDQARQVAEQQQLDDIAGKIAPPD